MALRRLHICSGRSGAGRGQNFGVAFIEEGIAHAAEERDAAAEDVNTIAEVHALLARLLGEGVRLDYLDFHTHGADGQIGIGDERIYEWSGFTACRNIFADNATIRFHGCNVADGPDGEYFLTDCGSLLLRRGGGRVVGHAGYALASRAWGFPSTTPSYIGATITARVRVGGGVTLENARFLRPHVLRNELRVLTLRLRSYQQTRLGATMQNRLRYARELLADVEHLLAGQPAYIDVHRARRKLETARRGILEAGGQYMSQLGPD